MHPDDRIIVAQPQVFDEFTELLNPLNAGMLNGKVDLDRFLGVDVVFQDDSFSDNMSKTVLFDKLPRVAFTADSYGLVELADVIKSEGDVLPGGYSAEQPRADAQFRLASQSPRP